MKRNIIYCLMLVLLLPCVCTATCMAEEMDEVMREKEARVRAKSEELILAVLTKAHPTIVENSYYEGFSSSKGYKIDEFLERYNNEAEHYVCSEIEIISIKVHPGNPDMAEVVIRAHLAVAMPHMSLDAPPVRVDVWEFVYRDDDWFLMLRR